MVGSWDRSGRTGWSSGDYLVQIDPNDPDPTPATGVQSSSAGRTFVARVTAYSYQSPAGGAHGSITRTGTQAHWGTVAVDPSVIPLGSRLLIEGFDNVFVAEDTGGGVRGNHIDIFFPDYTSAVRFGVQNRSVTVLSP
jgi:3D (Asp-Asp-Asp) domain-containing protein